MSQTRIRMDEGAAALLLMQVRQTAATECKLNQGVATMKRIPSSQTVHQRPRIIQSNASSFTHDDAVDSDDEDSSDLEWHSTLGKQAMAPSFRSRAVSFESLGHAIHLPSTPLQYMSSPLVTNCVREKLDTPEFHLVSPTITSKPVVHSIALIDLDQLKETQGDGNELESSVRLGKPWVGRELQSGTKPRAVLRKKFSWKHYTVLEQYLVMNRTRYLEMSSSLNYTAEQKRYNNALTQGLLDLAHENGYVFEGFTFAMVRDRIRCFYKSFVQAKKKLKRKKRKA